MLRVLSPDAVDGFVRDGLAFPLPALTAEEVAHYHAHSVLLESHTPAAPLSWRTHLHVHFRWAYELAVHSAVLDAVEDLLGPDVLVLSTILFAKNPGAEFVSWHQDSRYLVHESGMLPSVTAWIALSDSSIDTGCLRAIPGSHHLGPLPHCYAPKAGNLLSRGETVDVDVDESQAVNVEVPAGQMSLHHVDLLHGSGPNRSGEKRTGFTVRYINPRVASTRSSAPAVLARGADRYGNYRVLEKPPSVSFEEGLASLAQAVHQASPAGDGVANLRPPA